MTLPKLLQDLDTREDCEHFTTTADGTQDTSEQIFKDPFLYSQFLAYKPPSPQLPVLIAVNSTAHCSLLLLLSPSANWQGPEMCCLGLALDFSPFPQTQDFILFVCLFYL